MFALKNICSLKPANSKSFFGALNLIFNRVNDSRIKEVGPDRACAEWLMRNGALVRWRGQSDFVSHYDLLPLDPKETGQYIIEEVYAHEAAISHHGFNHFHGCQCVTKVTFDNCSSIDDRCTKKLCILANSLLCLEIKKCPSLCGDGLLHLAALKNLQILRLCQLEIKNLDKYICQLQQELPNCHINSE